MTQKYWVILILISLNRGGNHFSYNPVVWIRASSNNCFSLTSLEADLWEMCCFAKNDCNSAAVFSVYEPDASSFAVFLAVCQTGEKNTLRHYISQTCQTDPEWRVIPGQSCNVAQCVEDGKKLDPIWKEQQCWTLVKQQVSVSYTECRHSRS